jgi:alcohol dehydrogenase
MRAVLVEAFGAPPRVADLPEPECPDDGVLVAVRATGLCRSDWHGWAGHDPDIRLPHVPGHEFAGVVAAVGSAVTSVQVGDRVTVPFVCACGRCATCKAGAPQVCEDQYQPGFTGWGSFAELVAVPRADVNVVPLPDALDFATAAGLGCRFATAYRAVTAHGRVGPGDRVAVFGCGGVGLAATKIAAPRRARVIAVDVSPAALDLARRIGATETVDGDTPDPAAAIRSVTGGGAHVAIDALGGAATCRASVECLRPRGRQVQVGLMVGDDAYAAVPMARVIAHELEIHGSHGMGAADYPAMLAEIADGRLDPGALVSGLITLDDLAGADGALATMGERPPTGTLVVTL